MAYYADIYGVLVAQREYGRCAEKNTTVAAVPGADGADALDSSLMGPSIRTLCPSCRAVLADFRKTHEPMGTHSDPSADG